VLKASPRIALHVTAATLAAVGLAEVKVFCTRLDAALVREVKVYAATNGLHVQDVIEQALRAQLRRKPTKTPTKTRSTP
jgi:hypothetical protein